MPRLLLLSLRVSGCTRLGRRGILWVASAVALRKLRSSSTNPPTMRHSFPIFTYHLGSPVSPHMGRWSFSAIS